MCPFGQNPCKLFVKKLICSRVSRCQPASLSYILLYVFSLDFLRTYHDYFLKLCEHCLSFRKCKRKKCYLCFTCSITIHLNLVCYCRIWHLAMSWIWHLSNKQVEFFVSRNIFFLPIKQKQTWKWNMFVS